MLEDDLRRGAAPEFRTARVAHSEFELTGDAELNSPVEPAEYGKTKPGKMRER